MIDLGKFSKSSIIKKFEWLGPRIPYGEKDIKGDTFPLTWADDDEIYTSSGDPNWGETSSGLDVEKITGNPKDFKITKVNHMNDYLGWGGDGPKPSGMICVDGILYFAFQNMLRNRIPPFGLKSQHGSDAQIIYSSHRGSLWTPALKTIEKPMFPGHHFGGPAFINFGKNNADARDNFVYAISSDQWDNGTHLRLGRVDKENIIRAGSWQWVSAFTGSGEPVWHNDLQEAIPVLSCYRAFGIPDMVYLKSIKRYLLLTWRLHEDFSPTDGTDLIIFEAPEPWGPYSLVHFEEYWEAKEFNPYCPRLPLKWVESGSGNISAYMLFSGSWGKAGQEAGYYRVNVRPFRLTF
ncbi:MAG: hypothetical protein LBC57_05790 [Treponema sp.]|jgi:hypothetical protein|nr:hypothetical protein [Treponema sp.]